MNKLAFPTHHPFSAIRMITRATSQTRVAVLEFDLAGNLAASLTFLEFNDLAAFDVDSEL